MKSPAGPQKKKKRKKRKKEKKEKKKKRKKEKKKGRDPRPNSLSKRDGPGPSKHPPRRLHRPQLSVSSGGGGLLAGGQEERKDDNWPSLHPTFPTSKFQLFFPQASHRPACNQRGALRWDLICDTSAEADREVQVRG